MKKKTFAVDIDGTITENGGGRIHLDALEALRRLTDMGHNVIYVTGRSSIEAFLLAVYGGGSRWARRPTRRARTPWESAARLPRSP